MSETIIDLAAMNGELQAWVFEAVDGRLQIDGRILAGEIRVGDVFTHVISAPQQAMPQTTTRLPDGGLRIKQLIAYRRQLDKIEQGWTCRAIVSGSFPLVQGMVLVVLR